MFASSGNAIAAFAESSPVTAIERAANLKFPVVMFFTLVLLVVILATFARQVVNKSKLSVICVKVLFCYLHYCFGYKGMDKSLYYFIIIMFSLHFIKIFLIKE
ncbi:hypothetical protein N474_12125 [Pseudoalteromonas luteoviolacea CPMOR-2]|nr:hypothetical protein N474_12125 [Pseudoalteromonas luteoviolacea CPMOR-2]